MTYPIEIPVTFQHRVPNHKSGGETPLWIEAVVTDYGPSRGCKRYETELKKVMFVMMNILTVLDFMENSGYGTELADDIVEACERHASIKDEAVKAHVDKEHAMPESEEWLSKSFGKQSF